MKRKQSRTRGQAQQGQRRRGAVAAQTAICLTTLVGFTALTVDVGHMYDVKAELQRSVDAAALAAAAELGDWSGGSPKDAARTVAAAYATRNAVDGAGLTLDTSVGADVAFGRAYIDDGTNKYVFTVDEDEQYPNAVHVECSIQCPLYFAAIFGASSTTISARATAVLTPRDISFVLDLSTSHNDDSSLRSFKNIELNNKEVYEGLADLDTALLPQTDDLGFESHVSLVDNGDGTSTVTIEVTSVGTTDGLGHLTFGLPAGAQAAVEASGWTDGDYNPPAWGLDADTGVTGLTFTSAGAGLGAGGAVDTHTFSFTINNADVAALTVATKTAGGMDNGVAYNLDPQVKIGNLRDWGAEVTDPSWDFANDSGLTRLPKGSGWSLTSASVSQTMSERGYGTYTSSEMSAVNSSSYDSDTDCYRRRALVAMGVYRWKSGKTGGQAGGDGDNKIESGEVETMVAYPSSATNPDTLCKQVGGSWNGFVDYVRSSSSSMCLYSPSTQYYGDSGLQYRYGLKTFTDYLLEKQTSHSSSPGLAVAGSPQQPMKAVADAVKESLDIIQTLQGGDLVGIASYATVGYGPAEQPDNMSWLTPITTTAERDALQALINELQPGMWTTNTNIAQGIDRGVDVLFDSDEARPNAAKVLILLTDGIANQVRQDPTYWDEDEAKSDALDAAAAACGQGVRIYTISVGASADQDLMKQIADPTYDPDDPHEVPKHFHAEGDIADYQAELQAIFQQLGGERPVVLIE